MKIILSLGTAQALLATSTQIADAIGAKMPSDQLPVYTDLKHHSMRIVGNEYIVEVDDALVLRIAQLYLRWACFVAKVVKELKSFIELTDDETEALSDMINEPRE